MGEDMFKRYNDRDGFVPVPLTKGGYWINCDGKLVDRDLQPVELFVDSDGDLAVQADMWDGPGQYKVAVIIVHVYKTPNPFTLHAMVPFYIDGNRENLHPSNIGYRFRGGRLESKRFPGYYHVPMATRYVINVDGELIHERTGHVMTWSVDTQKANKYRGTRGGYYTCRLNGDGGVRRYKRHRAVALTFLPYPDCVDSMDVNHKNGVPGDDAITNLEFVTRADNCKHAVLNGLRNQAKEVTATCVKSGESLTFASLHLCAKHFGLYSGETIRWRINQGPDKVYNGYRFKFKDDDPDDNGFELYGLRVEDGTIVGWNTVKDAASDTGVASKDIVGSFRKTIPPVISGYVFSKRIKTLETYKRDDGPRNKPILVSVTDTRTKETVFTGSMRAVCNFLETSARPSLTRGLGRHGSVRYGPYLLTHQNNQRPTG